MYIHVPLLSFFFSREKGKEKSENHETTNMEYHVTWKQPLKPHNAKGMVSRTNFRTDTHIRWNLSSWK